EKAEAGGAEVAGVTARRLWVSAGEPSTRDPVGTARALERIKGRACWFHVSDWFSAALSNDGSHERMLIGCEPVWVPSRWEDKLKGHASVRLQIRRAKKKGVVCEETRDLTGLAECQANWLKGHPLPPLSFLTEPSDLDNITERRIFKATRAGRVEGFLVAAPVPAIRGWLVEQIARMPDAPNGTTEALIDAAMRTFADERANMLTLGLAPLSPRCGMAPPSSRAVGRLMRWSRAHGKRFYNFDGVEHFKAKLRPDEWRPVYAVVPGKWSVRDLAAVLEAFTKRRPAAALAEMIGPAIVQEAMWIFRGRR
ncbi:MAG TPA: phosphatidylglycerol lysyltransferase domain-containing protein, partial [Fimbriimonadaceae bacterium]|nr:phosphatidylglycerol lysyltransferase domain-containing protein [Fimbriimonadaceae bacterium]